LPSVLGHHATLVQIIANLLTNAIKFVSPGVPPQVRLWSEKRAPCVRLWVKDNGIGIAPEYQERIFGVFERLHGGETYPGTGIGLAIVRKGVARLGGRVGVESAPGQGSTFWVEFPIAH
jgi:signal transduction histidine kinase